ncbi:hypothetical protein DB346_21985 [Verrucomicrobia bacterium LW23]|nr:hypothetical protein DB346_21985 [Verrucomicrobia bacterium LW23]
MRGTASTPYTWTAALWRVAIAVAFNAIILCTIRAEEDIVAVTTRTTSIKLIIPGGGSAVKTVPANTRLPVISEDGETLTVRDASGFEGTISAKDVRLELAMSGSSGQSGAQTSDVSVQDAEDKEDALMDDAGRAPSLVAREDAPVPAAGSVPEEAPRVEVRAPETSPPSGFGGFGQTSPPKREVTVAAINEAFGAKLFADTNLWDDSAKEVAKRLRWPLESSTSVQSSYRLYAGSTDEILGARPYSLVLYAKKEQPDMISMVFANKGDFEGLADMRSERRKERDEPMDSREERQMRKAHTNAIQTFTEAVRQDARTIEQKLTTLLGPPERREFGTTQAMREMVLRWDWNSHAILLASPRDEYTAVRVMRSELADDKGRSSAMPGAELRDWLKSCVSKATNGDVLIRDIPMVDQGPKGFCAPATWERYLRYMNVPADMYILAMAGGTQFGGGTLASVMRNNAATLARQYGRRIESVDSDIDLRNIDKHIDKGLPILWTCFVYDDIEKAITLRSIERSRVSNWEPYLDTLKPVRREATRKRSPDRDRAHMRMIVGYNAKTKELAISDSWGEWAELRWITLEEAAAISAGDLTIMRW